MFENSKKKIWGGGLGGQGGCEWRSEAFVRIQKKNIFRGGGVSGQGGGGGVGLGGQGGCEQRIEAIVKIQKKKIFFFLGGGGCRVGESGWM